MMPLLSKPKAVVQWTGLVLFLTLGSVLLLAARDLQAQSQIVVYASQDQVYAEPILKEFERQTAIHVKAVFDSEAVKTVGLANRLIAERRYPQCDIFWSNEELRTRQLVQKQVLREKDPFVTIGFRSRRMVINTNRVKLQSAPRTLDALTNLAWRGKIALAYPLFGTTATHFLALRQQWGEDRWERWCRALAANQPFVVDGNSVAAQLVGRGEAWIGLTDSDDIAAEQRAGAPVASIPIFAETLLIPNTVAVTRNAPHPRAAQQLLEFLQRPETVARLVQAHALESAEKLSSQSGTLQPQWDGILRDLEPALATLKEVFLR